ncbi:hypothetical protein [Alteriqipengyuania lutimaris]|uniref:Uncharacterized protein n=1 Tax=Alteriqipengyuania lutimaris TaxID=1538146 RepID=A0A395LIZ3_9SPHN|nr:hypothetical protein [Alteriqipengyuania lutimaris]RDS76933.1 hypothetical protein DL238_04465 [Alteriqipengyuania lutimaris]
MQIVELDTHEVELVGGGALPLGALLWAGAKAAATSATGKKIAAGAFVAAVAVASAVMDD